MDTDVEILVLPNINWQGFIDLVQENLHISPTRVLDREKIDVKSPRAVLRSLESLTDTPKNTPPNYVWEHLHCSFIAKCTSDTANLIVERTGLDALILDGVAILTGSFNDWHLAIYTGCTKSMPRQVRSVLNECFSLLINYNLNLWPESTRNKQPDGTLVIKAK